MMRVLLLPGGEAASGRGGLSDEEAHHLRVRRARDGEAVEIRDGAGLVGTGRLVQAGQGWEVEVERAERQARPADLTLAVGAGDRERFAWVVEKAAELGVTRVVPLETERTAGVSSRVRAGHLEKLRRIALEAVKQCGAAWACQVAEPVALTAFAALALDGEGWLAEANGNAPPAGLGRAPLTVVIGPEGGVTEREAERLLAAGFRPTALGPHTLRFETAALAAAAIVAAARLRRTDG